MKKSALLLLLIVFAGYDAFSQAVIRIEAVPLEDEYWWDGLVALGSRMPFTDLPMQDMARENLNNQPPPADALLPGTAKRLPLFVGGTVTALLRRHEPRGDGLPEGAAARMPVMRFSVAPWRILSKESLAICARYAGLHRRMGGYILSLAQHASKTGEPVVRHLEYAFPHQGFAACKDQFMLGGRYLAAPMVTPGTRREATLPKGKWRDEQGKIFRGGRRVIYRCAPGAVALLRESVFLI